MLVKDGRRSWRTWLVAAGFGFFAAAHAQDVTILYHERLGDLAIVERVIPHSGAARQSPAPTLSFVAFGRQFDLELASNERLTRRLPPAALRGLGEVRFYEGELNGIAGSWARLVQRGAALSGVVWDGQDFYAIEPLERLGERLASPAGVGSRGPAIYRWRDTLGSSTDAVVALTAGATAPAVLAELSALPATSAGRRLALGLIGDAELVARDGDANARAMLLEIANVVDGIFLQQLGVQLDVAELETHTAATNPFTTSDPGGLLTELGRYKQSTPALRGTGLAHLVTGRDLVESPSTPAGKRLLGIANFGVLCDERFGVGLTQAMSPVMSALTVAHELGHNFGAPHDNEPGSVCAETPGGFLMAPSFSGSRQFSQCSIDQMQAEIAAAPCFGNVLSSDVGVRVTERPTTVRAGEDFAGSIAVDNDGVAEVLGVELDLTASGFDLTYLGVPADGSCSAPLPAAAARCSLARLAAGDSVAIQFRGRPTQFGAASLEAAVTALNDANAENNRQRVELEVLPYVDFELLAATATPSAVRPGEASDVTWEFVNRGVAGATGVTVQLSTGDAYELVSIALPGGGACLPHPFLAGTWECPLAALPPLQTQRLLTKLRADPSRAVHAGGYLSQSMRLRASAAEPELNSGVWERSPLVIAPSIADLAVDLSAPVAATEGAQIELTLQTRNARGDPVTDVTVGLAHAAALAVSSIDAGDAICSNAAPGEIRCTRAQLAAGESFSIRITGAAQAPRGYELAASVDAKTYDDVPANNRAQRTLLVQSAAQQVEPAPVPPATSDGGGGGATDPAWLLALLGALAARIRNRGTAPRSSECGRPTTTTLARERLQL